MWFWRMTVWPWNSRRRQRQSPMIVLRRWPTCISLAIFGLEKSTTTFCGSDISSTPRRSRSSVAIRSNSAATYWGLSRRLMKPGPAISGGSQRSLRSSCATTCSASLRGLVLSLFGQGHHAIGLVVAEFRVGGRPHNRGTILPSGRAHHRGSDSVIEYVDNRFHLIIPVRSVTNCHIFGHRGHREHREEKIKRIRRPCSALSEDSLGTLSADWARLARDADPLPDHLLLCDLCVLCGSESIPHEKSTFSASPQRRSRS